MIVDQVISEIQNGVRVTVRRQVERPDVMTDAESRARDQVVAEEENKAARMKALREQLIEDLLLGRETPAAARNEYRLLRTGKED